MIILFVCTFRNRVSREVNEGAWICKVLGVIALFWAFLYINNSFFLGYSTVAKFVSFFFLLFQIIMIIDLCYIWGEKWVEIYDEGNSCWVIVMIIASLLLYAYAGYIFYKDFEWFAADGCGSHRTYIIISIVLVLLLTILTLTPIPEQKSIITSGAVSLYVSFLTWSALTNSKVD